MVSYQQQISLLGARPGANQLHHFVCGSLQGWSLLLDTLAGKCTVPSVGPWQCSALMPGASGLNPTCRAPQGQGRREVADGGGTETTDLL